MDASGSDGLPDAEVLQKYLDFLLESNQRINLVSRRITRDQLQVLVNETLRLARMIGGSCVVDAGSGNGLLGIVLSVFFPQRRVILLESIEKKAGFLRRAVSHLGLINAEVFCQRLENFTFPSPSQHNVLVSRGFPDLSQLVQPLVHKDVREVVCITSLKKIEKLKIPLENIHQTIYNIPFRDVIKILKMENVSRETISAKR
ncbi:MAG TPA: hypothetical protein ENN40_05440 [Candidatus Aminicenantes bacterium]|nr:hypothetical protein [Candidatus Aminicenantes bacterium]